MAADDPLKEFTFRELEAGPRRDIARAFTEFTGDMCAWMPDSSERSECLVKLLEARDAALRAAGKMLR